MDERFVIRDVSELEAVIGPPIPFLRRKILDHLDGLMREFIQRSPLLLVSTRDAEGAIDVSPGEIPRVRADR